MNTKSDLLKQNERIIYLILVVALVISLITISTCNKRTLDENFYIKSQVQAISSDLQELEVRVVDQNSELKEKANELQQKKKEIEDLISNGKIDANEAQKKIKSLRQELADLRETAILEKNESRNNKDSLANIVRDLRSDNTALRNQVVGLERELSKKQSVTVTKEQPPADIDDNRIKVLQGTKVLPKGQISLALELYQVSDKDQIFQVYIYDDENVLVSPQSGIYSFTIAKGEKSFNGSSTAYKKGVFKSGRTYSIAFRNSKGKEIYRYPYKIPLIDLSN